MNHMFSVAKRTDGSWGVFCLGCSHKIGDYAYPCKYLDPEDTPPAILKGRKKTTAKGVKTWVKGLSLSGR